MSSEKKTKNFYDLPKFISIYKMRSISYTFTKNNNFVMEYDCV
jgi:hypothetical protein